MWSLYCDLSATLWKWSSELLILHTNIADKQHNYGNRDRASKESLIRDFAEEH